MGGGDLNLKKSWHPATLKNQERVWKEERKHSEEQRKIEQMKKELMEERQLQELQRLQEEVGQKQRSDRLDWMYAAPNTGGPKAGSDEMEEYLLGKKNVDSLIRDKNSRETVASSADERFAISNANANNERDIQAKIREDPLLMIKRREQASLRAIMDNPLAVKELKKSRKEKKSKKDKKDKKDTKDKIAKHERTSDRVSKRGSSREHDRERERERERGRERDSERRHHRHRHHSDRRSSRDYRR